jgi:hypothetical protein
VADWQIEVGGKNQLTIKSDRGRADSHALPGLDARALNLSVGSLQLKTPILMMLVVVILVVFTRVVAAYR